MITPILTVTVATGPPAVTVLRASGELDHDSRGTLKQVAADSLPQAGARRLVIDLSEVTFCDSGGLSLFVELHREIGADGGWVRLAGARGMVRSVLEATNLDRMFTLYDSVPAAATA